MQAHDQTDRRQKRGDDGEYPPDAILAFGQNLVLAFLQRLHGIDASGIARRNPRRDHAGADTDQQSEREQPWIGCDVFGLLGYAVDFAEKRTDLPGHPARDQNAESDARHRSDQVRA